MTKELAYIDRQDLMDTADALRERLSTTNTYATSEFADAIREIQGGVAPETPTISISNSGLITASANGLSATQQLMTQAAATITPSESAQTAVATGKYTTGAVTVSAISSSYVGTGVTRKAAATITPGTTNQTIAANTYLTGVQTIEGDADLIPRNIVSTANIFGVQGSLKVVRYYVGTSVPANTIGNNGDLYLVKPTTSSDPVEEENPFYDELVDEENNLS